MRALTAALLAATGGALIITAAAQEEVDMLAHVQWLGHAGIKITGEKVVYVDPFQIEGGEPADLILITHDHFDHLSPEDIAKVRAEHTVVVVPASAKHELRGKIVTVEPGDTLTLAGIEVRAVPAYNPGKKFHPRTADNVGYVFTVGGVTYYHAGDTDLIPEMAEIEADVAFLPVGGTFTMNPQEAVEAARRIGPRVAVPIHWGKIVGTEDDARAFEQGADCEVRILSSTR